MLVVATQSSTVRLTFGKGELLVQHHLGTTVMGQTGSQSFHTQALRVHGPSKHLLQALRQLQVMKVSTSLALHQQTLQLSSGSPLKTSELSQVSKSP
jgi:hypothetical protein